MKEYIIFQPLGPNLFLSIRVEWKKHKANSIDFTLGSLYSISSLLKYYQAFFIFAFNPAGGSYVNLIDLSNIPIGTNLDG